MQTSSMTGPGRCAGHWLRIRGRLRACPAPHAQCTFVGDDLFLSEVVCPAKCPNSTEAARDFIGMVPLRIGRQLPRDSQVEGSLYLELSTYPSQCHKQSSRRLLQPLNFRACIVCICAYIYIYIYIYTYMYIYVYICI